MSEERKKKLYNSKKAKMLVASTIVASAVTGVVAVGDVNEAEANTIVNTAPVIHSVYAEEKFSVVDPNSQFKIYVNATDVDNQTLGSVASYRNRHATSPSLELALNGSAYDKGFYMESIKVTAHDGIESSNPMELENHIIISVNNAEDYKRLLNSHTAKPNDFTQSQHLSFYKAYEAVLAYEMERTGVTLDTAVQAIIILKNTTGIQESATINEWNERLTTLMATTEALEKAEISLVKADYAEALTLFKLLTVKANQDLIAARITDLGQYHTTNDLLVAMEEKMSDKDAFFAYVDLAKINDVRSELKKVTTASYKKNLTNRLNKVLAFFLNNKPTLTAEDLVENGVVVPEINIDDPYFNGIYDDLKDAFEPLVIDTDVSNAQQLVYVSLALRQVMMDLDDAAVTRYKNAVATALSNGKGIDNAKLATVTEVVDKLLAHRKSFKENASTVSETDKSIQALTTGKNYVTAYFNNMNGAIKEVTEYNSVEFDEAHSDVEKNEGYGVLNSLWTNTKFKNEMQSYLDNGIPDIYIESDKYEYIHKGNLNLKGTVTDSNDSAIVLTLYSNGEVLDTKTISDGQFNFTITTPQGHYGNALKLVAKDALTEKKISIIGKPIVNVTDVSLFTEMVKALEKDRTEDFTVMGNATITDLVSILNTTLSLTSNPSLATITNLTNSIENLSTQSNGALEALVYDRIQGNYLQWIYDNHSIVTVEDFKNAGVLKDGKVVVTSKNLEDMKTILSDYKASANAGKLPTVSDYVAWTELLASLPLLDNEIEAAYKLLTVANVESAIANLKIKIDEDIPAWLSVHRIYETKLLDLDAYKKALASVLSAEKTISQESLDAAQLLVDAIENSAAKASLQNRLDNIQAILDAITSATQAVVLAENELKNNKNNTEHAKEAVAAAQSLVSKLIEGNVKDELQQRLDLVTAIILARDALTKAENQAMELSIAQAQITLDDAFTLVNALKDEQEKASLTERLTEVQEIIDARQAIEDAAAIMSNEDLAAIGQALSHAQNKINLVDTLKAKEELQSLFNNLTNLTGAIEAVKLAEDSENQADVTAAANLVTALPDSAHKSNLVERLAEVQKVIDATAAVVLAETSFSEADYGAAVSAVNAILDTKASKALLEKRLQEISRSMDAMALVEKAEQEAMTASIVEAQVNVDKASETVEKITIEANKTPLVSRLTEVQEIIDARQAIEDAAAIMANEDLDAIEQALTHAQDKIEKVDTSAAKAELESLFNNLANLTGAIGAVKQAENTESQADVTAAADLVTALPDSTHKSNLSERLAEVQKVIDATAAVVLAETSFSQADYEAAVSAVAAILDTKESKAMLQKRLQEISHSMDAMALVVKAEEEVMTASIDDAQGNVDKASEAVEKITIEVNKTPLVSRLAEVQEIIDARQAIEDAASIMVNEELDAIGQALTHAQEKIDLVDTQKAKEELQSLFNNLSNLAGAIEAVKQAEVSENQADVTAAADLVTALPNSAHKSNLSERLAEVEKVIDATAAVVLAETSFSQADYEAAVSAVAVILDTKESKAKLQQRLQEISHSMNAMALVLKAEQEVMTISIEDAQTNVANATEAVNKMTISINKTPLENRLVEVQEIIDARQAIEDLVGIMANEQLDVIDQALAHAQDKINLVDTPAAKTELQSLFDHLEDLAEAIEAVKIAEVSESQADVSIASDLIKELEDSAHKSNLSERLLEVQKVIDATTAVVLAETTFSQADYDSAVSAVEAINDVKASKALLQQRLQEISHSMDAMVLVEKAEQEVMTASIDDAQANLDKASEAVEKITIEVNKTPLVSRLAEVQEIIDARQAIEDAAAIMTNEDLAAIGQALTHAQEKINLVDTTTAKEELQALFNNLAVFTKAIEAVKTAEASESQPDVTAANDLVTALPDSAHKSNLLERLAEVQKVIDATAAVVLAETSFSQTDYEVALSAVNTIIDTKESKALLEKRLQEISRSMDAMTLVVKAEQEAMTVSIEDAQLNVVQATEAVEKITIEANKTPLVSRLKEVQEIIDARQAIEDAAAIMVNEEMDAIGQALTHAQEKIDLVDTTTAKEELQALFNNLADFTKAIEAVKTAETSESQTDVTTAKELVTALADGAHKSNLLERLAEVQKIIDATAAVALVETTFSQADYEAAVSAVDAILDTKESKAALLERLQEISHSMDARGLVEKAEQEVMTVSISDAQANVKSATDAVNIMTSDANKTLLFERLTEVQEIIDARQAIEDVVGIMVNEELDAIDQSLAHAQDKINLVDTPAAKTELQSLFDNLEDLAEAIEAVKIAEVSESVADVTTASNLVDAVENSTHKDNLKNRINEVQKVIDGTVAVAEVESSFNRSHYDIAVSKVNDINDAKASKANLLSRLVEVLKVIEATDSVKKAEDEVMVAGVADAQTNLENAQALVSLISFTTLKDELNARLVEVQEIIDARQAIDEVVEIMATEDNTLITQAITNAQNKIELVDTITAKELLQEQLDNLDTFSSAISAVLLAEEVEDYTTKDAAQILVDILPSSTHAENLNNRLNEVQKVIDGKTEVTKVEETLNRSDYDHAVTVVSLINDVKVTKEILETRLAAVLLVIEAIELVERAENSESQADKDKAQELVETLPESAKKDELNDRLKDVQEAIDKKSAEDKAEDAVKFAEKTWDPEDIQNAQDLIEGLTDETVKEELQERLDKVQELVDIYNQAEGAVAKAEEEMTANNVTDAQKAIDDLIDLATGSNDKTDALQDRLNKVNDYVVAEKAVVRAESLLTQGAKDAAQQKVDILEPSAEKDALQDRLDKVQEIISGKGSDLLDKIIDNPQNVTGEELAEYVDSETVYEELLDEYRDALEELVNNNDVVTKDDVTNIIRFINALALAKREMTESTIQAYNTEYDVVKAKLSMSNYPSPVFLETIEQYVDDDSVLTNLVSIIGSETGMSEAEILDVIANMQVVKEDIQYGSYTIEYVDESGELIEKETFTNVPFGEVTLLPALEGYEVIENEANVTSFELTEDTNEKVFTYVVKELVQTGSYTMEYVDETGKMIHTETFTDIPFGEISLAPSLEGYEVVENESNVTSFELNKDTNEKVFTYVVKELVQTGSYTIEYVDETGKVIHTETFTDIPFGEISLAPSLEGYEVIDSESNVTSFELTKDTDEKVFVFTVKVLETEAPTEETDQKETDELPVEEEVVEEEIEEEVEPVESDETAEKETESVENGFTIGEETEDKSEPIEPPSIEESTPKKETNQAQYKTVKIANLDNGLILTSTTSVFDDGLVISEEHAHYLMQAFLSLEGVKTVAKQGEDVTEEYIEQVKSYIVSSLLDGAYKEMLLTQLGIQIGDIGIGNDGIPDLTPIVPVKPEPPVKPPVVTPGEPTDPDDEVIIQPSEPDEPPYVPEIPVEEITKPKPKEEQVIGDLVIDKDGSLSLHVDNPNQTEYELKGNGTTILLQLDKSIIKDLLKLDIRWIYLGNDHFKLEVYGDGEQIEDFEAKLEVAYNKDYLVEKEGTGYTALPYQKTANAFKFKLFNDNTVYFHSNMAKFSDIHKFKDRKAIIEELAGRHIVFGENDRFNPNGKVTRAQLASMITRALNLDASDKATPFKDTVGKWYEKDVQALYEAGMISGTSLNSFAGDQVLTRQQAALMLNQVLEKQSHSGMLQIAEKGDNNSFAKLPTFADRHKIADNALIAVGRLENAGIVTGNDGNFNPHDHLTRAQIAKMLAGVLKLTGNM